MIDCVRRTKECLRDSRAYGDVSRADHGTDGESLHVHAPVLGGVTGLVR